MIPMAPRSEEHTSELQSRGHLVCRLLLEKKKIKDRLVRFVLRSLREEDAVAATNHRSIVHRVRGAETWSDVVLVARPRLLLFFFNDTATTEIYTLSLHDALPI